MTFPSMRAPEGTATAWALAALAAAIGVGVLAWRQRPAAEEPREELSVALRELGELREALRIEREARRALAADVARLRADLEARPSGPEPAAAAPAPEPPPVADAPPDPAFFDTRALLELQIPEAEVERLRELHAATQLDLLYLRDRALREGWADGPRMQRERHQIQEALREQLDESEYDRLLFATGRPNRVVVGDVLLGSPAESAGLREGDLILRYDEQRVFDPRELVRATAEGSAGAHVPLEVWREGSRRRFFLPRGPIGVRLRHERRPPEGRW